MALDVVYNAAYIGTVKALTSGYTAATDAQALASLAAIKAAAEACGTAMTALTDDFTPIAVAAGDYENLLTAIVEGLLENSPTVGEGGYDFAADGGVCDAAVVLFNGLAGSITT